MDEDIKSELYRKAWKKWGDMQLIMVIEECSELQKSITKYMRNKDGTSIDCMCEEIGDVEIMCEQLRGMINLNEKINRYKEKKLLRLSKIVG